MKPIILACLVTMLTNLQACAEEQSLSKPPGNGWKTSVLENLLPRPRQIDVLSEDFIFSAETTITVTGPDLSQCCFIGERLSRMIEEEFGTRAKAIAKQGDAWRLNIQSDVDKPSDREGFPALEKGENAERYRLELTRRGACASAVSARGLLWATMTFRQLLGKHGDTLMAAGVRIDDQPRYPWRGFMIDSGRAPNSLAQMKRIARICSAFKLNFVVFREGDDELAAVRYKTNKLGRENPYALSMDEVKDFVAYCEHLGIAVVPEIESLGHSGAKGFAYRGLAVGGRKTYYEGIGDHLRKAHLNPDDPRTITLLESIYSEWFPLLNSPFVHLGLDEVRLPPDAQSRHMSQLLALVEQEAKRSDRKITSLVWSDAPATPEAYRGSVVRVLWSYAAEGDVGLDNTHLLKQRIGEVSAKNCPEKVMMAGGSDSYHTPYSKSGYEEAFRNVAQWARFGDARPNFIGLLAVQWGGNMLDQWVPDFLAAADMGWNPPKAVPAFSSQMSRVRANLARLADSAHPAAGEVDRPAWDGIWLKGENWDQDILQSRSARKILKVELGKPVMDMLSHGDVWDSSWADDGHLYASSDDTKGFVNADDPKGFSDKKGRNLKFHILQGESPETLVGKTINQMDEYHGMSKKGPDGCMWKANGNICIDGNLYLFVSRHGLDFNKRQSAERSSLIMSADKGLTWRRTAKENYDNPMFVSPRFGSPMFVKYGQDGKADVDGADKYVYALANDGFWENGDDMILARALKSKIAALDAKDWQFFTGGDGTADANWSQDMKQAKPVLANPGKCSMAGAQYIAPLKRYFMIQWYYTTGSGHKAPKDTTWIFYESAKPWGPWHQIGTQRFSQEGYYNPCIVSKFISSDGRNLMIFTNGDFFTAAKKGTDCIYRLTKMPCRLVLEQP